MNKDRADRRIENSIVVTTLGARLLLRLMNEDDPDLNYIELTELGIIMTQLNEIVEKTKREEFK